jgi:small conductance mechanosensitive channel
MDIKSLVVSLAARYGIQVLSALGFLIAGLIVGRWIGGLVDQRLRGRAMEPPMRMLLVRVLRVVIMLFAILVALDNLGFQVAPLVAGLGVAGIGVGFALQGVLSNLVAGLTIIFTKPFRVGEYVEIVGVRGDVIAIDLSSTTLLHPDRSKVVIPNRKIVGEILHNFSTSRQLNLTVGVAQPGDVVSLLRGVRDVVMTNPRVLKDPMPAIGIAAVTDGGVKIAVQPWVRVADVGVVDSELYQALLEHLRARGLAAPAASQHEVRLVNGASVK